VNFNTAYMKWWARKKLSKWFDFPDPDLTAYLVHSLRLYFAQIDAIRSGSVSLERGSHDAAMRLNRIRAAMKKMLEVG